MSLNTRATCPNSNKKRATSPHDSIRKYLTIKPSAPSPTDASSSPPAKKALSSTDDNIKPPEKANRMPVKSPAPSKSSETGQSRFLDLYKTTRKNTKSRSSTTATTASTSSSCTSSGTSTSTSTKTTAIIRENRPSPVKRSYSAMSHLDTVNKSWMNSPISSNKKACDNKAYDRLTPGITDMLSAQAIIKSSQQILDNTGSESYQEQIAHAIGIDTTKRILSFKQESPRSQKIDISKNASQTKLNTHTSSHVKRHILQTPEKILDAPYMDDDYYLNVLDWSKMNVVAVGLGKAIYLWNADNGTIQALNYNYDDQVASVNWSGDGSYLAVGTAGGDTQIWDVQSNTKLRTMHGQNCRIGVLSWDKHLVSSGGRDGSIFHHDVRMAKHTVRELYGHSDEVCGLKWRWDGQSLASGGNDNTVNIWDARSTEPAHVKRQHTGAIKALAWCPWNHSTLATGGGRDDKQIHFWNSSTGARMKSVNAGSQVTSLHWSHHHKEIVSTHGLPHNQLTVWAYPSLNKVIDIPAHESRILHSALSPDGQVLATAAADENLKFWRIFEHDGKARLGSESSRLTMKKEVQLRRTNSIR
ncbi:WD repeat-containing protein slp1 [Mucor circinelloides]